jgi:hypothetical protein
MGSPLLQRSMRGRGAYRRRALRETLQLSIGGISDPSCHLAEQRVVGVVEGEQKGGAWTTPAEGPAKGWAAEAIHNRR